LNLHGKETVDEYCLRVTNIRLLIINKTKDKPLLAIRLKGIQKVRDGTDINWIEGQS
jgi:hypothetical protein